MPSQVFICYRREDSGHAAGRLYDRLRQRFGASRVFIDISSVDLGINFVDRIQSAIGSSQVVIAVIGQRWLSQFATNDLSRNYVLLELATALKLGIPIIPVLVDNATLPSASQLPAPLSGLSLRQGISVHHETFELDMERLIQGITVTTPDPIASAATLMNDAQVEKSRALMRKHPLLGSLRFSLIHPNQAQRKRNLVYFWIAFTDIVAIFFIPEVLVRNKLVSQYTWWEYGEWLLAPLLAALVAWFVDGCLCAKALRRSQL